MTLLLILFSFLLIAAPLSDQPVVQIVVEKQPIQSIALHRLSHEYRIPLYVRLPKSTEQGAGWLIDSQTIVTNHHVIAGGIALGVQWEQGTFLAAEIVGAIPELDIAVLRLTQPIELSEYWRYSQHQAVGDDIIMGGFGLSGAWEVRRSTIVATSNNTVLSDERQSFIQVSDRVTPGFSGGPAWNTSGELIGMVTAIDDSSSYLIPISIIQEHWETLLKNESPEWGMLGIQLEGTTIVAVNPKGPLQASDVGEVSVFKEKSVFSGDDLHAELRRLKPNEAVSIVVNNQRHNVQAQSIPHWNSGDGDCLWRGATLFREENAWRVHHLSEDSSLYKMGILPNDVLLRSETCPELKRDQELRIIQVQRGGDRFMVISPSR